MSRTRRSFTPAQKAEIVRRHLLGKVAVSELADECQVQPSLIHTWVKQVLDRAEKAFDPAPARAAQRAQQAQERQIARLEEKLARKNEVVAELLEEHVQRKKALGEP